MWGTGRTHHNAYGNPSSGGTPPLWGPTGQQPPTTHQQRAPYSGGYFGRSNDPNFQPTRPSYLSDPRTAQAERRIVPEYWTGSEESQPKRSPYDKLPYQSDRNQHWGDNVEKDIRRPVPEPVKQSEPTPALEEKRNSYGGYHAEPEWYHRQSINPSTARSVQIDQEYQKTINIPDGDRNPGTKR